MTIATETITTDQAQFLASVESVDAALSPQLPGDPAPGAALAVEVDKSDENAAMFQSLVDVLSPALPFLPGIYTPAKVKQIAAAYTAVEVKRGWNLKQYVNEEMQLLLVAGPPTVLAVITAKAYIGQMKAAAAAAQPAEGASDGHQ